MPIATNRRPAVVKGTVSTLLLTFFIFPATGPAQEGFAFHFKSRLGIANGIECRLSLMVDKSPHGHPLAIITPIFYGMPSLPAPMEVIVGMTDERYVPWAQVYGFKEVRLEVFDGVRWLKPRRVIEGPTKVLPGRPIHVYIRVEPNSRNDSFAFLFKTLRRPSRLRLIVEDGQVYDIRIPDK